MKTIGMIGGLSWESTTDYYRLINEGVKSALGGLHSARCLLNSVDFAEIEALQSAGDWEAAGQQMALAAQALERGGADFILICSNTMHKVVPAIESLTRLPILHLADATADRILEQKLQTIGLLGTRYTMEEEFYRQRLEQRGLRVIIPESFGRDLINNIIYQELCLGACRFDSRQAVLKEINQLTAQGAQGIILGCTELGILIKQTDTTVPLFDTTEIHANAAVQYALK